MLHRMYFRVNLKMKKPTLCCCFIRIAFIELNFTVAFLLIRKTWHSQFVGNSVDPPPFFAGRWGGGGGGGLSLVSNFQIFKKGGLKGSQFFYIKNKLKSEIFNNKKRL